MKRLLPGYLLFFGLMLAVHSCKKTPADATPQPDPYPVSAITLDTSFIAMKPDATRQFTLTISPANASNKRVTWGSSNTMVATVDTNGTVKALRAGEAIITATSISNNSIAATARMRVLNAYDLYIAGNGSAPSIGIYPLDYDACYWKNGIVTHAGGGSDVGRCARSIVVAGDDVYMAGETINDNLWYVPTLWKNGSPLQLTPTTNDYLHYAYGLAVNGNDIYVAGFTYSQLVVTSGLFNASLFRINNNVITPIDLPKMTGFPQSDAYGVATIGNDVYTAGSVLNNFSSVAVLWKNNEAPITLTPSSTWGKAKAVAVSGNDVYIAGYEGCADYGCTMTFKVWKNNGSNAVVLGSIASLQFDITGIAVSGSDVYVSGHVENANHFHVGMVWKISGGVVTAIPLSDGTRNVLANGITVKGSDVFVVGYELSADNSYDRISKARYWRLYDTTLVETYEFKEPEYELPYSTKWSRAYGVVIK